MSIKEYLQSLLTWIQSDLPILYNIQAIVAISIVSIPVLYLFLRKIINPSTTVTQESNPRPHPQKKANPIQHKLLTKILLHVLIQQIDDPFIFEYSDMANKYTISDISRHIHYCKLQGYLEGSIDEDNQLATLEITKKGRYYLQLSPPSSYL